jgi:hypothetical protein
VNLLFDSFKSFCLKLFELIFCLAHISSLNFFVNFFGSGWRWHFSAAYITVGVTYRIEHCASSTLPFHHQSFAFAFILLFLFFLVLFLNFLEDFFFNKLSNVPSFDADTQLIVFGEDVKLRCEDFAFVIADDLLDFRDKLIFVDEIGYFFNEKKSFPLP